MNQNAAYESERWCRESNQYNKYLQFARVRPAVFSQLQVEAFL
jgi:hypothetical protein